jgi:hypothetical protein
LFYGVVKLGHSLGEECRLRVLKRIFGPKRNEVTGEWRRLQDKGLYALYSSPNVIWMIKSRRLRLAGYIPCMGERRGAYRILMGKPKRRPHGRPRHRWEENIKMGGGGGAYTGFILVRVGTGGGLF